MSTSASQKFPTPHAYIFALIRTFPCLARKVGWWLDQTTRFDPDEFHALFNGASTGEIHCSLFILNVWNPGYAESKGWTFDLFAFMSNADDRTRSALLRWIAFPYWP